MYSREIIKKIFVEEDLKLSWLLAFWKKMKKYSERYLTRQDRM